MTMTRKRIRILFIIYFLALFAMPAPAENKLDCFTIIAGKNATYDSSVMLAHNEDDSSRDRQYFVNIFKVESRKFPPEARVSLKNGGQLNRAETTAGYYWIEIAGEEFGDTYINDHGVVIVSNRSASREDKPVLTSGGIGMFLRRIVAGRAKSAREAVIIAGGLIDKFGYYSSGRTYCFADAEEGWLFHAVAGKHWLAKRIPDDHVATIPNYYTIGEVNLSDKKNYLGSSDIIDYAIRRKWYDPKGEEPFDFAKAYSDQRMLKSSLNTLRQWRAVSMLSGDDFKLTRRFPFSFEPRRKLRPKDLIEVLRDHYEGTDYDLTDGYAEGSPNNTKNRTICTASTQYSLVAQLRQGKPKAIANILWIALRRPDSNAFSPWYPEALRAVPSMYSRGDSQTAWKFHLKRPAVYFQPDLRYAFWNYARLSELVDKDYKSRIKLVKKEWKNYENYIFKTLKKREKEFEHLLKINASIAREIINNYVWRMEFQKLIKTRELVNKFSTEETEKE